MNQGDLLVGIFGAIIFLSNVVTAWAALTGRAQKREIQQPISVTKANTFVTEQSHAETIRRVEILEKEMQVIREKMETDKTEILDAGQSRASFIGEKINEVDRTVAALDERTKTTNSTINLLERKLDKILERISS